MPAPMTLLTMAATARSAQGLERIKSRWRLRNVTRSVLISALAEVERVTQLAVRRETEAPS